jgi:hypothetical protein
MLPQAGFLSSLGLSPDDAKAGALAATKAFSEGVAKDNEIGMAQITGQYSIQSDRRNAQSGRSKLEKDKAAVNAASLTRTMATQVDAMNAQGAQQVAAAASGITGTSMKDISSAMSLEENVRIQSILTQTEAQRFNISKQQQTIDYQMELAELSHTANQKMLKSNRKFNSFNTIMKVGMSAFMGGTKAGNQT